MTPSPGDPAPDLAGITLDGARLDLAAIRGKPVLVEFFRGTW